MRLLLLALPCVLAGCSSPPALNQSSDVTGATTVFDGARLITGDPGAVIERSSFVVANGTIVAVGRQGDVPAPAGAARVDLTGKTVMPALVDAHSHLGYTDVKAMTTAAANYTRQNLVDHLHRYAYYGVGATLSMGVDRGALPYELRSAPADGAALFFTAGRGIALPNAGPGAEYRRDAAYGVSTESEARAAVRELAATKADLVKIWVDDRDGTVPKLPPPLYRAIIDEAHRHGLRVAAHIFDLDDAKELLRAGVDGFAHGVRDRDVDDEFVAMMQARPHVFVIPNLPDREAGDDFAWLADTVPAAEIERLRSTAKSRTPAAAKQARDLFDVQARNLARLNAAGVKIGYGTDAGVSVGWPAHTELADMVAAGMTPAQVITAATRTSAEILALERHGTLAAGKSADFIVLDANPLGNITHTRRIADVYLRGTRVDRAALSAQWTGSRPVGSGSSRTFQIPGFTRVHAQQPRTTWDGIYSREQADRGAKLYAERCARCHGDALQGVEAAPALVGIAFYGTWEGETLDALFERMRMTMPQDSPGALSRAQNADLLAHMLRAAGYPAGQAALDTQAGALTRIIIRLYKPGA